MALRSSVYVAKSFLESVFRPSKFVAVRQSTYDINRTVALNQMIRLTTVFFVNVLAYAVPLTLAGIGFTSSATAPGAFVSLIGSFISSTDTLWQLLVGTVRNSAFLTVATALVLVSYHGAVVAVRSSKGFLQSFHTVVYTTSVYLVGLFTGVMYLSTANGLNGARKLVINVQKAFFYVIIDYLGANVSLPSGRPGEITITTLSPRGEMVVALVTLCGLYFLYSLYLGARINHRTNRIEGTMILIGVALAPVAYIASSVIYTQYFPPIL